MRALHILSGIAVLFTSLGYAHLVHHFFTHSPHGDLGFWTFMVPAIAAGILSFIGAFLLLKRTR